MHERQEYKGYYYRIEQDELASDPREDDNLGHMLCFHSRYTLGDKTDLKSNQFHGWDDVAAYLIKEEKAHILLPLYLYDHSGLRMKVGSFQGLLPQGHAEWDSGQVGIVYITKAEILQEYSAKRVTKALREKVLKLLEAEVETYDAYISGAVYGFIVEDKDGEHIDSCWGFYGYDGYQEAERQAKEAIDCQVAQDTRLIAESHAQELELVEGEAAWR